MTERAAMLRGDTVYRVHWRLGTDILVGVCHCGAEHASEDPVELWEWLLAHPDGHRPPAEAAPAGNPPQDDVAPDDPAGAAPGSPADVAPGGHRPPAAVPSGRRPVGAGAGTGGRP